MSVTRLLIANRGEIAIRIARAAADLGISSVAVFSDDDARSLHTKAADQAVALGGVGARAYLDIERMVRAAQESGCDAVHPGYGFLAENADFARALGTAGIKFIGPRPEVLERFGDKVQARALAKEQGVPVLPGTGGTTTLAEAKAFLAAEGAIMIKAIAGGGGRGMRPVTSTEELDEAYARCQSEALAAFGNGDVYMERLIRHARHIEVQIVGDGSGHVSHLFERECTIQRRNQKIIELAPSPNLSPGLRAKIIAAAVKLASSVRYDGLGTFEFLVDADGSGDNAFFAFIEANPRLQVEHTVTEAVTGIDLVQSQIAIAGGRSLESLGLLQAQIPTPRGLAVQLRVNLETMDPSGNAKPAGGQIATYEMPSGPGVRVDGFGYAGYSTSPNFDSLLAKLIVHAPAGGLTALAGKARRALSEFRIEGVATNIPFLDALLRHPDFLADRVHTRFIEEHVGELLKPAEGAPEPRHFGSAEPALRTGPGRGVATRASAVAGPPGTEPVAAPMQGTVVSLDVAEGATVRPGQQIAVLSAMKMEHLIRSEIGGIVRLVAAEAGETLAEGQAILFLAPADVGGAIDEAVEEIDLDAIRPDLREVYDRHAFSFDENRPDAVARRRKTNQRTVRENVAQLVDPGSFVEYGSLAVAAQRRRRPLDELIRQTPGDGMVTGIGSVNGDYFDEDRARCMILAYDYTVLAGTQGMLNHKKKDRLLHVAAMSRLPIVVFAEGGGGRPGDTDVIGGAGLDVMTFYEFAKLSALVPRISIVSGRCFAGNAALAGCADVIIATANTSLGMGGPAMIEGGGLGVYQPDEVGPMNVQSPNGVVDVAVADEVEAIDVAKKYLAYFQGSLADWDCADQRELRRLIPENRLRVYDVRKVISTLADTGSVLELRRDFAHGMVTSLIRIEGRPMGLIANDSTHLAGAIDADGGDKAARFMQLCDAFGLPILTLCDTPGIMVGPEAEKTALVRHCSRMFVTAATVSVPIFTIVLRKGYGLGAQAMAGGSFHTPFFIVSWPTGEFGGMGLEGAVRLGFRRELAAVSDPTERQALFEQMVARSYEHGKALNTASHLEIDQVIDPVESRRWILRGLKSMPPVAWTEGKRRAFIDTW